MLLCRAAKSSEKKNKNLQTPSVVILPPTIHSLIPSPNTDPPPPTQEDGAPYGDIEDLGGPSGSGPSGTRPMVTKRKRVTSGVDEADLNRSWRVVLGSPPAMGEDKVSSTIHIHRRPVSGDRLTQTALVPLLQYTARPCASLDCQLCPVPTPQPIGRVSYLQLYP